ncbi:MAG: PAS-domain containing protein [Pseudomonadota bacterium]
MIGAVLLSAVLSMLLLWVVLRTGRARDVGPVRVADNQSVFLIQDDKIIDQCGQTPQIVGVSTWLELRRWLGDRFCDVPQTLTGLGGQDTHVFEAADQDDTAQLTITPTARGHAITLEDHATKSAIGHHALLLENRRADRLQTILRQAPAVVFAVDTGGKLQWGNDRFENLSVDARCTFIESAREFDPVKDHTICIEDAELGPKHHYELSFLQGEDGTVIYAVDVTRLIEADTIRKSFIQTLTKTFADLSTGLAVFDLDQRLVLFNPAIPDLTNLPVDFLTTRPHMMEFFDRLRDNHVMPEPKNYSTWRKQITQMINSAAHGHYSESWSLPGGLTYKLTGRPHPNGAVAFLIEDITDEMALTRQSRSQLETHQSILDAMQEAIAVLGPDGRLLVCNAAFSDVIGFDPDEHLAPTSFKKVMDACQARFPSAALWKDLSNDVPSQPINTQINDTSGRQVHVRVEPLHEGLTMLNLSVLSKPVPLSA